jgi:hypothetical protein
LKKTTREIPVIAAAMEAVLYFNLVAMLSMQILGYVGNC